mgnify:CR=1 FL=1
MSVVVFFFQAEDGIRDRLVTGVQTCALPIFTPFATLGGEPIKAQLLKEHQGISLKQAVSSQILSKTTFLTGLILFFIPGITMIMNSSQVSDEFKTISIVGMGTLSTCIFLFFV